MENKNNSVVVIGPAPSIHNISVETEDYILVMAQTGENGPIGYVVQNKHTQVFEYVARAYPEATNALKQIQGLLDDIKKQARTSLTRVQ